MSAEQARLIEAKAALRRAMSRLPFDHNKADATRIDVWKKLVHDAEKLLNRSPAQAFKYEELTRQIEACGSTPLTSLVEGVYEKKEHGIP